MSPLHVRSKVCMVPFHVLSKVWIAPFHLRSKVYKFAPHMDRSHADFAPHVERRHIVKEQNNSNKCQFKPIFKNNFLKPPIYKKFIWHTRQLLNIKIFLERVSLMTYQTWNSIHRGNLLIQVWSLDPSWRNVRDFLELRKLSTQVLQVTNPHKFYFLF